MGSFGLYLILLGIPLVVGLLIQAKLKRSFAENSKRQVASGLTGAQVAQQILLANGLSDVHVGTAGAVRSPTTTTRGSGPCSSRRPSTTPPR